MKNAAKFKFTIVGSLFNEEITGRLVEAAKDTLQQAGVLKKNIHVLCVPGAYEIPFAVQETIKARKVDGVLALGCIIKGETSHDQHIAGWVSQALGDISLRTRVPVLFGVLTPNNEDQALERSSPGPLNRGKEVAEAALHMAELNRKGWR